MGWFFMEKADHLEPVHSHLGSQAQNPPKGKHISGDFAAMEIKA
jgi:hypothetical protein